MALKKGDVEEFFTAVFCGNSGQAGPLRRCIRARPAPDNILQFFN